MIDVPVYLLQVKWRSDEGDAKFGYRNTESFVSNDKDVAAVCSLSFHLPKDAVASGAMRPVFIADPSKNANTVIMSFFQCMYGQLVILRRVYLITGERDG